MATVDTQPILLLLGRTGTLTMAFQRLLYSWDPPQEFICHAMQFPEKKAEMRERSHAPPDILVIGFFFFSAATSQSLFGAS